MNPKLLCVVMAGLSVGCAERRESGWQVRCTKQVFSHFIFVPVYVGKVMQMNPIAQYRCVQRDSTYFAGPEVEATLRILHARNARNAHSSDTVEQP